MNTTSLASVFSAALRQPVADQPSSAVHNRAADAAARSALLMSAVRRSLESCRDPAQLRMLQAFGQTA